MKVASGMQLCEVRRQVTLLVSPPGMAPTKSSRKSSDLSNRIPTMGTRAYTSLRSVEIQQEGSFMFDVVCVGFGPANIALAVALDEIWPAARVNFVKRDPAPCWQRR